MVGRGRGKREEKAIVGTILALSLHLLSYLISTFLASLFCAIPASLLSFPPSLCSIFSFLSSFQRFFQTNLLSGCMPP